MRGPDDELAKTTRRVAEKVLQDPHKYAQFQASLGLIQSGLGTTPADVWVTLSIHDYERQLSLLQRVRFWWLRRRKR